MNYKVTIMNVNKWKDKHIKIQNKREKINERL